MIWLSMKSCKNQAILQVEVIDSSLSLKDDISGKCSKNALYEMMCNYHLPQKDHKYCMK